MKKITKESLILLLLSGFCAVVVGWFQGLPTIEKGEAQELCVAPSMDDEFTIQWIGQQQAHAFHEQRSAVFVDARQEQDYEQGHILGAIHLGPDVDPLPTSVITYLKDFSTIVTYCDTKSGCSLSTQLAKRLSEQSVSGVRILEGGFVDWVEHGFPAEAGACKTCPSQN